MRFYAPIKLGPRSAALPNGFHVWHDCVIARTGEQEYPAKWLGIPGDESGKVLIDRPETEVFRDDSMASFNGSSLVDDHPYSDVGTHNWRDLEMGTVFNVRRGTGEFSHALIADLLVKDAGMVKKIRDGKVELSCGYDAQYRATTAGRGEQFNIVGNHVAVVREGRCGELCRIRDSVEGVVMAKGKIFTDRIRNAFRDNKDAEVTLVLSEVERELDSTPAAAANGETHIHVGDQAQPSAAFVAFRDSQDATNKEILKTLQSIQTTQTELGSRIAVIETRTTPVATQDSISDADRAEFEAEVPAQAAAARTTTTSAIFRDSVQHVNSLGEIMKPGIALVTLDEAASPKKTLDSICAFRRSALLEAAATEAGKGIITTITGSVLTKDSMDKMGCSQVRILFNATGEAMKRANSTSGTISVRDAATGEVTTPKRKTQDEIDKEYAQFWAQHT